MAWTDWLLPRTITYFETDEVAYADLSLSFNISSVEPVQKISLARGQLLGTEPNALLFADYNSTVSFVAAELELHVSRLGRIQDKTIRLRNSAGWVGPDRANLASADVTVYAWEGLSASVTPDFGAVVDLQPHTQYPSSNTVYIRSVRMRFFV